MTYREMDNQTTMNQIGKGNVLAVSGGRVRQTADGKGLAFPVSSGYRVEVMLTIMDTYEIRRVFKRGAKEWIKGQFDDVYNTELGEAVYRASCYKNVDMGEHAV